MGKVDADIPFTSNFYGEFEEITNEKHSILAKTDIFKTVIRKSEEMYVRL